MRKLSNGNKKNFVVFFIIILLIIAILVTYLYIISDREDSKYQLSSNTFFYDSEDNPMELKAKSEIERKWDNNYYIKEENNEYKLGEHAIVLNQNAITLDVFGEIYKVTLGGQVEKYSGRTEILDYSDSQLYKLEDRKYLIIASEIVDTTGTLNTENYLIVTIDRSGNTLLQNHEVNTKIINPMTIITDSFEFDIANEKLIYSDGEIDLKKIIGSTNEYIEKVDVVEGTNTEEENDESEQTGQSVVNNNSNNYNNNNSNNTDININNGNSNNNGNTGGTGTNSGNQNFDSQTPVAKSISLRGSSSTSSTITVDYSIIDVENMYQTVYLVLSGDKNDTISLDKNQTSYTITGLNPNKEYTVSLNSKEIKENGTVKENIEDVIVIRTKDDSSSVTIDKVGVNNITGTLKIDQKYIYQSANIVMILDKGTESERTYKQQVNISQAASYNGWVYTFDREVCSTIEVRLEDVYYSGTKISPDVSAMVRVY